MTDDNEDDKDNEYAEYDEDSEDNEDDEDNDDDEDDEEDEDDANGTVAQPDSSRHQFLDGHSLAEEDTEGSCHNLLSLPCLVVKRGGGCDYDV